MQIMSYSCSVVGFCVWFCFQ